MTELGLYLHFPYCRALCPYCDFAKTANFDESLQEAYLNALQRHLELWLTPHLWPKELKPRFTSVFIGGGTPSLVTSAYEPLFALLRPYLVSNSEITLEANPDDICPQSLSKWHALGITRLSMGVQTFDSSGLKTLKRIHDGPQALEAAALALKIFPNLNIDLIYGWPAQTLAQWQNDLRLARELGVPHLSLYTLTYEPRTPMGRSFLRGRLQDSLGEQDDLLARFYEAAQMQLGSRSPIDTVDGVRCPLTFLQDEVSNWATPGFTCRHNWLYWQDKPYLAVGAGAHGYLPDESPIGMRYAYDRSDRRFIKTPLPTSADVANMRNFKDLATASGALIDKERTLESWLLEYIGSGLRTRLGIDQGVIQNKLQRLFLPRPLVKEALETGTLHLDAQGRLSLGSREWFRETAWALEVARSWGV
jgi:oxygen-independent coproporphyrinogen-3 oxidase